MKINLLPFQDTAKNLLRRKINRAVKNYCEDREPQIVSFTANTGAGKTIILISLVESIYRGDENYPAQRNAIFVWLSDSPELNEQSRKKFFDYADEIIRGKLVTISDETFDGATLADGKIYFLNTQKLSKTSNLTRYGDRRQYTIWETLQRTATEKFDRLYLIIDEAHRGARNVNENLTIMQKFIKGSPDDGLKPLPVTVGMSATIDRFNELVKNSGATISYCAVPAEDVRQAGLLKDRILVVYPDADGKDMSMLRAATLNWLDKCASWRRHKVKPIFIVQVQSGTGKNPSDTDLDECLKIISDAAGKSFQVGEVVHTFDKKQDLTINGLKVVYCEPSKISADERIKIVLFKENLSTGWDCPRAETMMSFRRAVDATYIAQLIGRMIRTPQHRRIDDDETLNEVQLFLPQFDRETVKNILDKLQRSEFGAVTDVDSQSSGENKFQTLTIRTGNSSTINREEIFDFINTLGLKTYRVDGSKSGNPVTKLFELARLLNQTGIYHDALDEIKSAFVEMIRERVDELREAARTNNFKLNAEVIDLARNETYGVMANLFAAIETDTDRQFEAAKKFFGDDTIANEYIRKYKNVDDPNAAKLDVILFANNPACMDKLKKSAERKFKEFDGKYRVEFARKKIPYKLNFCLPEKIILTRPKDGANYDDHLFVDENGTARIKLNTWEVGVLKQERTNFVCWFRNEKQKPWALCLPYQDEHGEWRGFYPDMLIFRRAVDGFIVDILEPHGAHLPDNLGKAKALANYAADNPIVGRVEMIRQEQNFFRRLDMKRVEVREKVLSASTNAELNNIFEDFAAVT